MNTDDMVYIPSGPFQMGKDRREVHVDGFWIDVHPVTNAEYKRFVDATPHRPPPHWVDGEYPPGKSAHPVVGVSFYDAQAYAAWAGKRLPREEEWEKAARGDDGRIYPWGNEWEGDKCNTWEAGIKDTTPVGRYSPDGDSPYGCADMAGNVWEWTSSMWNDNEDWRVVRGGSWSLARDAARCACRYSRYPGYSSYYGGFRCVSSVSSDSSGSGFCDSGDVRNINVNITVTVSFDGIEKTQI